ncbi:MAG: LPS export ABC transporter permease LptG [Massilia sp.]
MKTLQRYFTVSILQAVAFALIAFLSLNAFFDLTNELPNIGKSGYGVQHAFLYVILRQPYHVFEVMPIASLLGTIYTMAQFASSSEFTIMRASGMSTRMAAWMLFKIGIILVLVTFVFGELIAPRSAPLAEKLRLSARGATISQGFVSGMWTKDVIRDAPNGKIVGSRFFNVRQFRDDGKLMDVRLYEFDTNFRMRSLITAARASYKGDSTWRLEDVTETLFSNTGPLPDAAKSDANSGPATFGQESSAVTTRKLEGMDLVSEITPKIISVSASDPDRMSANELAVYTRHLNENKQEAERFKIAFWKKLIDPLAIFVMMALALPFAYMQARSGGVSLKIFVGIMIGVGFMLVNSLFAHIGLLSSMPPILTAIAPSLVFMTLALVALWKVERI